MKELRKILMSAKWDHQRLNEITYVNINREGRTGFANVINGMSDDIHTLAERRTTAKK